MEITESYFNGKSINDGSTCEYSYENLNKYQITVHEDFKFHHGTKKA